MTTGTVVMELDLAEKEESNKPIDNKIICNTGTLKSKNGLLLLFETIIGIIVIGLIFSERDGSYGQEYLVVLFLFVLAILASTFRSFLFFISYMISPMAAESLPKTVFEFVHNLTAVLLCGSTSIALIVLVTKAGNENSAHLAESLAPSGLGLLASVLYCLSTFYSFQSFKAA